MSFMFLDNIWHHEQICVLRKGKHSPGVHSIDPVMTGSDQPPDEGRCLHAQNTHLAQLASLMSFSLNKLKIKQKW